MWSNYKSRLAFRSAVLTAVLTALSFAMTSVTLPVFGGEWIYPSQQQPATSTTTTTTKSKRRVTTPVSSGTQASASGLKLFLTAVRANFAAWDRNHDGSLDRQELEVASQDSRYIGDAAAALSVLISYADSVFRKRNELPLVKLSDMDAIETKASTVITLDPDYGKEFEKRSAKLGSEPRQLFKATLPHLIGTHQARTLDSYFLASVGGLAMTNPRALVDMINQNSDGTYDVTFPGRAPISVSLPTDTEIAENPDAEDGFWVNILEKAYSRIRILNPKQFTAEPLEAATPFRGDCSDAINLLTGHKAKYTELHPGGTHLPAPLAVSASIKNALADAFSKHQIVTAAKGHQAYTVTEYNTIQDTVTIHIPQGGSGYEIWRDSSKGPRFEHGFFKCSVDEFIKNFRGLWYEI